MVEAALNIRLHKRPDAAWGRAVADLDALGVPVPLPVRSEWARHLTGAEGWLVSAHDTSGRCVAALGLDVAATRALPGHRLLRAHHLGAALIGDAGDALLTGLRDVVLREPRILRVNLEWILRTPEEHARVAETLGALGFHRVAAPRNYRDTLVIDLVGSEDEILASFSQTTRQDLRRWTRYPVVLRPITDPRYADRLNALARETFARTGGPWTPRPWAGRIRLCAERPSDSLLLGLFRAGRTDPDALVAYAWGCADGDHAHYDDAGSTRADDLRVPLASPLVWELVRWSKRSGCRWFDLGGITLDREDPLWGISSFKLRFSKKVVAVGAEWEFEPHPLRARLARSLRAMTGRK